jgi:hypothetical protein
MTGGSGVKVADGRWRSHAALLESKDRFAPGFPPGESSVPSCARPAAVGR